MKKSFTIIVLAFIVSLASAQKGVTFEVDKGLPAPKTTILKYNDQDIAQKIVNISAIPKQLHRVVKTSFEGERLCYIADDNSPSFGVVARYSVAHHQSGILPLRECPC